MALLLLLLFINSWDLELLTSQEVGRLHGVNQTPNCLRDRSWWSLLHLHNELGPQGAKWVVWTLQDMNICTW